MTELIPNFFISSWRQAHEHKKHDPMAHVITVMNDHEAELISDAKFSIVDGPGNDYDVFVAAVEYTVQQLQAGKKVIVHCHGGRSRSMTVCVAALAKYTGKSMCEAYDHVKDRHPIGCIHPHLAKLLLRMFGESRD